MRSIGYFPWIGLFPTMMGVVFALAPAVPGFGTFLYMALPPVTVLLWFLIGRRCGRDGYLYRWSVLSGHWGVAQILLVALWQWGLVADEARNATLAVFSQLLMGLVPGIVTLVMPFCMEGDKYVSSQVILWSTAATALALVLIFSIGYWFGLQKRRRDVMG